MRFIGFPSVRTIISVSVLFLSLLLLVSTTGQKTLAQDEPEPTPLTLPPDPAPNDKVETGPLLDSDLVSNKQETNSPQVIAAPLSVAGGTWLSQGPGPAYNGQVEGMTNLEVVGAIHALAAHPTNPNILYVGSTNGGVWKTTNALAASPNWVSQTDNKSSLSIGALEFDPTDATNNTLVAGIGRYSSFAQTGGPRTGLLRTIDGGTTWTEINGTSVLNGRNISGVAPRGNTIVLSVNIADVFSCANIGIFRSTNGGANFVRATGIPAGTSHDLASDPLNDSILYTSVTYGSFCTGGAGMNGVYKSIDTGASWTKVSNATMDALIIDGTTNNLEIAARGNNVFANIIQSGRSVGIFSSSNGGTTWTAMDLPLIPKGTGGVITTVTPGAPIVITTSAAHNLTPGSQVEITNVLGTTGANGVHLITSLSATTFRLNGTNDVTAYGGGGNWRPVVGMNPKDNPGGQGGIHASIVVDPTTPGTVYVGGDRQDLPFPNYIGANNYTGSLFRGNSTIAATGAIPSPQWDHLTHSNAIGTIPGGGTASSSAPHADSREMVFDANGNIIEVDDGGVYRRTNPQNKTGNWFSINGDMRVTEIHSVAYDNLSNMLVSGNQDTGTTYQTTVGAPVWTSLSTGDGGDVAVDNIILAGSNQSVRYTSSQNFGNFRKTVWDTNGGGYVSSSYPALSGVTLSPQFTTPMVTNNVAGGRLLIGAFNELFESTNQGTTISQVGSALRANSGSDGGNTMDYGGKQGGIDNPYVLYVATGVNVAVRTASGGPVTINAVSAETIRGVAMDPVDWNIAYAIDSNQVFRTINGGTTWTDVTGTLSDTNLRSIAAAPGELFVGGEKGVYTMDMAVPGAWSLYGSGLPNVPVWNLDYDNTDKMLVAGTLGRGAWLMPVTPVAAPLIYAAPTVAACASFAPCLAVTNPVQNAITAVANNGTVRVIGSHTLSAPLTNNGKTVTVEGVTGTLNSTLNFTNNGFSVTTGSITVRGLNLTGASTVFNQTGGSLTAYANNITGWTTAVSNSGGTTSLGNNWWGSASAVYNATDPGLPAGDWAKRLGADIASWNMGQNSAALGSASLNGGAGTAVIVSYGRDAANAPFGNGIAPFVDDMCSDYYDFFVRGSGTWNVTVPVDNTAACNTNTRDTDRLFHIPTVANCAPTNTQCWTRTGLIVSHGANDLVASALTSAQLNGTHFVAGDINGFDPTAIQLVGLGSGKNTSPSWLLIVGFVLVFLTLGTTGTIVSRRRIEQEPQQRQ